MSTESRNKFDMFFQARRFPAELGAAVRWHGGTAARRHGGGREIEPYMGVMHSGNLSKGLGEGPWR
jgi:hypothetical protein